MTGPARECSSNLYCCPGEMTRTTQEEAMTASGAAPDNRVPENQVREGRAPENPAPEHPVPENTGRMPAIYLSHGAPPLADDALWTRQLAGWARELPKPKSVLMVSAHWEAAPLALGATTTVPLTYDFWGFEDRYYQVRYPAPGAPELASDVRKLLRAAGRQRVMAEFAHWGQETPARGDLDALLDFQHKAPAARQAHPRTEHFAPLFVTLGASGGDLAGAQPERDEQRGEVHARRVRR